MVMLFACLLLWRERRSDPVPAQPPRNFSYSIITDLLGSGIAQKSLHLLCTFYPQPPTNGDSDAFQYQRHFREQTAVGWAWERSTVVRIVPLRCLLLVTFVHQRSEQLYLCGSLTIQSIAQLAGTTYLVYNS